MATRNHRAAAAPQPGNRGEQSESWVVFLHRVVDRVVVLLLVCIVGFHAFWERDFGLRCDRIVRFRASTDLL